MPRKAKPVESIVASEIAVAPKKRGRKPATAADAVVKTAAKPAVRAALGLPDDDALTNDLLDDDTLMRGTWRADKARLYVSNSPRRDTGSTYTIAQQGKLLSLDPDPYFSNADVPSKATYERLR